MEFADQYAWNITTKYLYDFLSSNMTRSCTAN